MESEYGDMQKLVRLAEAYGKVRKALELVERGRREEGLARLKEVYERHEEELLKIAYLQGASVAWILRRDEDGRWFVKFVSTEAHRLVWFVRLVASPANAVCHRDGYVIAIGRPEALALEPWWREAQSTT